jgi:hypothetical protein
VGQIDGRGRRRFLVLHGWPNHRPHEHWQWQLTGTLRSEGNRPRRRGAGIPACVSSPVRRRTCRPRRHRDGEAFAQRPPRTLPRPVSERMVTIRRTARSRA